MRKRGLYRSINWLTKEEQKYFNSKNGEMAIEIKVKRETKPDHYLSIMSLYQLSNYISLYNMEVSSMLLSGELTRDESRGAYKILEKMQKELDIQILDLEAKTNEK